MKAPRPSALCFLDILGFSALLEKIERDEDFGRLWFMDFLASQGRPLSEEEKAIRSERITVFSDCCVVSNYPGRLNWVVAQSRYLAQYVLWMGALSRGAIVIGNLYHGARLLYGTGLVEAYRREQSKAIYPRIVLDRGLVDQLILIEESHLAIDWREVLRRDVDGQWYVDLLVEPFGPPTKKFRNIVDTQEWISRIRLVLNRLCEEATSERNPNPKHLSKIIWASDRFNTAVNRRFQGAAEPLDIEAMMGAGSAAEVLNHETSGEPETRT